MLPVETVHEEAPTFIATPVLTFLARFLPDRTTLSLDAWHVDGTAAQITLHIDSIPICVTCPLCHVRTSRVHSRYTRTVADLPWDFLPFVNPNLSNFYPSCTTGSRCIRLTS